MEISKNDIEERYSNLNDTDLIELYKSGDLTEMALSVLKNEIKKRGLTDNDMQKIENNELCRPNGRHSDFNNQPAFQNILRGQGCAWAALHEKCLIWSASLKRIITPQTDQAVGTPHRIHPPIRYSGDRHYLRKTSAAHNEADTPVSVHRLQSAPYCPNCPCWHQQRSPSPGTAIHRLRPAKQIMVPKKRCDPGWFQAQISVDGFFCKLCISDESRNRCLHLGKPRAAA